MERLDVSNESEACSGRKRKVPDVGVSPATKPGSLEGFSPTKSGDRVMNNSSTEPSPSRKRPRANEDWLIHPPDGSEPIDLNKEAEAIFSAFEQSLCRDVAFELHRELHTGVLTNERLWAETLHPPPKPIPDGDVYGRIPPRDPSTSITCPSCGRAVGAARYAPHLDKCVLGSSRGRASRPARSSVRGRGSSSKGEEPTPPQQPKSAKPVENPTPAVKPAAKPATKPTTKPAKKPTTKPAKKPTTKPAKKPTTKPAIKPTTKPANKPTPKPDSRPSTSNPPKSTTTRPPSRSGSRPPQQPAAPRLPQRTPRVTPPPAPSVVQPMLEKKREPLHILIKLVDGSPVQTYHRVLLTAPQPKSTSSRSFDGPGDRAGSRETHSPARAADLGRKVSCKKMRESSPAEFARDSRSKDSRRPSFGPEPGVSGGSRRGSVDGGCATPEGGGAKAKSLERKVQGRGSSYAVSGGGIGSGSVSRPSSPKDSRGPPPMFIPASANSPSPSRQNGTPNSRQKGGSSAGCGSRYTVMT